MTFQIQALDAVPFADLFDLADTDLTSRRAIRVTADAEHSFPCRVTLEDAQIGEELVLVNYTHMDKHSPYHASHAVYVRKGAKTASPAAGVVPDMLTRRLVSVRGFDQDGFMREADVVDGKTLAKTLSAVFDNPNIAFADIHFAKPGCFAARATRA